MMEKLIKVLPQLPNTLPIIKQMPPPEEMRHFKFKGSQKRTQGDQDKCDAPVTFHRVYMTIVNKNCVT